MARDPKSDGWFRPLAILVGGNIVFGSGLFFHSFLYNFYIEALGQPASVMGYAAAALTAGGLASLLPDGWLTDRWGARGTVMLAAVVTTGGLAAGALVVRPVSMYLAASVAGVGGGLWRVAVSPLLMRLSDAATRPRAFAWNVGLMVLAGGGGVALAGWLPDVAGAALQVSHLDAVRLTLMAGAACTALSVGLFALLPRAANQVAADRAPTARRSAPWFMLVPVAWVALWMLGPAFAAPFFNIYFTRTFSLSVGAVGAAFGIAHLLWGAGVLLSGELAARIGVYRALAVTVGAFGPAMWALSITGDVRLAGVLYVVQGLISPITNPLIDQALLTRVAAANQGLVSSWRQIAADASAVTGAAIGGQLVQAGGFASVFVAAGAVGLLGASGLLYRLRRMPPAVALATE